VSRKEAVGVEKKRHTIGTTDDKERKVHIVEEKVFAVLSNEGDKDHRRWVLDTGASNHMTGSQTTFTNINVGMMGTVRFGDGSVVRIEG
jgi:hypothetical protein